MYHLYVYDLVRYGIEFRWLINVNKRENFAQFAFLMVLLISSVNLNLLSI